MHMKGQIMHSDIWTAIATVSVTVASIGGFLKFILNEIRRLENKFDGVDTRFNQVDQRFDRMDQRFDRMDERTNQSDNRLNKMDTRFENSFNSLRSDIFNLSSRFSIFENMLATHLTQPH